MQSVKEDEVEATPDEKLLEIITGDTSPFKDSFIGSVRLELLSRGYHEDSGNWAKDRSVFRLLELENRIAELEARLPETDILSKNFWPRALAVFGHAFAIHGLLIAAWLLILLLFSVFE